MPGLFWTLVNDAKSWSLKEGENTENLIRILIPMSFRVEYLGDLLMSSQSRVAEWGRAVCSGI